MARILVVDDEPGVRSFLCEALEDCGHEVHAADDGAAAWARLERETFQLLVTDLRMPGVDGMTLLERTRAASPDTEVIVLTAHGSVESAVEAMKKGAFEYLLKPLRSPVELRLLVERALERRTLRQSLRAQGDVEPEMIATAPAMRETLARLRRVAPTPVSVLLLGESGTGKELAARALHAWSPRHQGPLVAVNCPALSPQLFESEMFGHEKGAFTGAAERRRGRFETADGGTLFLDEVGELEPTLQAKLLRVLQERRFERVGGSQEIRVDVRIVTATNRDLGADIRTGRFREDLYQRLAGFPLTLPPLRERREDIAPLARHLLERIGRELERPALSLDAAATERLAGHPFRGNVRELSRILQRAAILASDTVITAADLVLDADSAPGSASRPALGGTLRELEREAIRHALAATGGHRRQAALRLGIGLRTLYDKLKEYQIE